MRQLVIEAQKGTETVYTVAVKWSNTSSSYDECNDDEFRPSSSLVVNSQPKRLKTVVLTPELTSPLD